MSPQATTNDMECAPDDAFRASDMPGFPRTGNTAPDSPDMHGTGESARRTDDIASVPRTAVPGTPDVASVPRTAVPAGPAAPRVIDPSGRPASQPARFTEPTDIEVRGARVHNLKNLSVERAVAPAGGHRRRLGLGEKLAGARRAVRGGQSPLPGGAFHLHAPPHRPERPRHRRRGPARARRAGPAPASRHPRRALHLRHLHRAAELPAAHVLAPGLPSLPERPPEPASRSTWPPSSPSPAAPAAWSSTVPAPRTWPSTAAAPARNAAARASSAKSTSPRSCRGPEPHPGGRRRGPLAQPHVVAHAPGGAGNGRAHRRAPTRTSPPRSSRHRAARPHGEAPHPVRAARTRTTPPSWTSRSTAPRTR